MNYIDIPIDFILRKNRWLFSIGPYLAYALKATKRSHLIINEIELEETTNKKALGLALGLGYVLFSKVPISITCGYGLLNVSKRTNGIVIRNSNLSFIVSNPL